MADQEAHGYGVILLTFVAAYVLAVLPLPHWLQWGRPEWVALVLIYWCIALPHRVGMVPAWCWGWGWMCWRARCWGRMPSPWWWWRCCP